MCTPPVSIGFDVLQRGNRDLRRRPLAERRRVLEDLLDDVDMVLPCRRLLDDGAQAWREVEARGFEGMVAKDPASHYRPGPTRSWVKVKVRHEGVFYVDGIRNVDAFDGALVGELLGDRLEYRGVVEWGFRATDVLELLREMPARASLFVDLKTMRGAVWLDARLRAEVSYAEVVGGRLRVPSWQPLVTSPL